MKIKKQEHIRDCGLHVIQSLHHHYYNSWISINKLKHDAQLTDQGLNISSLASLGFEYGVTLEAFNAPISALKSNNEYFIVLLKVENNLHYVIIKWDGDDFDVWDSSKGHYNIKESELKEMYGGVVITTAKGSYTKDNSDVDITNIWSYLSNNINLVAWILVTLTLSLVLTLTSTLFMKIIFDKVVPNQSNKFLILICLGFSFLGILRCFTVFFKTYLNKKLCNLIEIDLTKRYIAKARSTTGASFEKLDLSDHMRRLALVPSASLFVATGIQIIFDEAVTLIIASALLIYLSPILFGIAIGVGMLSALISLVFNFFIRDKYLNLIPLSQQEFVDRNELLRSHKNIKQLNRGNFLYRNWNNSFFAAKKLEYNVWKYSNILGSVITLIKIISPIILTYFSILLVFDNKISLGSFLMFLGLFNFFISPLHTLSEFVIKSRQNLKHIELIQYVMEMPDQVMNETGHADMEFKTISISNLDLTLDKKLLDIEQMEILGSIKLLGSNGTGKSLLLKSIAGLFDFNGQIMYNNIESQYLSKSAIQNKVLFISDEEYIFNSTVIDYITLGNKRCLELWKKYDIEFGLSNFLKENGISLLTKMTDNANNFSQGQRQLIRLMRIFATDFDILILDEALEFIANSNVAYLKRQINNIANFVIEVSHSKKYITKGKEVNIEKFNKSLY